MGPYSDAQLAYLMGLFGDVREDVDSEPFAHESMWASLSDVDERMKEARLP